MYKRINNNLLYHGCILMEPTGEFETIAFRSESYQGKAYFDYIDTKVRRAYFSPPHSQERYERARFHVVSVVRPSITAFRQEPQATFERYFVADKSTHKEHMNAYYKLLDDRMICEKILRDFDLDPANAHIVNGHVPVKLKAGKARSKGRPSVTSSMAASPKPTNRRPESGVIP
jgi:fructose-1,6-bisphosphatase-3